MVARNVVVAGAGLVGVAATITSAVTLFSLGEACGISAPFAAALPIVLDVGAAVGSFAWINDTGSVRKWGRGIAIGALICTVAGNSIEHAIEAHKFNVGLPLVLLVGICVPGMLWLMVHLAALVFRPITPAPSGDCTVVPAQPVDMREPTTPEPKPVVSRPVSVPAGTAAVSRPGSVTSPATIESKRDDLAERITWLRAYRDAWQGDERGQATDEVAALMTRFNLSESTAKRIRRKAREEEQVAA